MSIELKGKDLGIYLWTAVDIKHTSNPLDAVMNVWASMEECQEWCDKVNADQHQSDSDSKHYVAVPVVNHIGRYAIEIIMKREEDKK